MPHRLGARQDFSYFSFWVYTFSGTHRGTLTVTHIHWLPQPDFLKLAAKITLPRLGAPAVTLDHFKTIGEYLAEGSPANPLEEQTIMDFRTLNQPHDLRSQLGLAMSPEPVEIAKGVSTQTITVDVHANEPSKLSEQVGKMIAERAVKNYGCISRQQAERIGILKPNLLLDARVIQRLVPAGQILIRGQSVEDFLSNKLEGVVPVMESDITSVGEMTTDLASVLRGIGMHMGGPINLTEPGKPIPVATNAPDPRTKSGMAHRLDTLDQETLALLVEVGNRPGHDRRRVDAARTQFELAFMMLKRAIEEG